MKDADKNLPIVFGQDPNSSHNSAEQQDSHSWDSSAGVDSTNRSGSAQSAGASQSTFGSTSGNQQEAYERGYQEGYERARQAQSGASNSSRTEGTDMTNKNFTYLLYGLFIGGYFTGGLTAIAALVLAYAKRGDVINTIYYSHMENIIHSFWVALLVGIFAYFLIFTFILAIIGWPLIVVLFIWTCYRMIKGFLRISDNRAYN